MNINPKQFIENATLPPTPESARLEGAESAAESASLELPAGVVVANTLIDFSGVSSLPVRAGVSLAMLFASRVATGAMREGDDEDDWLAAYTSNLGQLGFGIDGVSVVANTFNKVDLNVHQAIIPFLTLAFGGAAIGPIILEGLKQLQQVDADAPWIKLFERESKRLTVSEMHFAAVSSDETDTRVRYAVARLNVKKTATQVLFFRLTKAEADFRSATTTMRANNSLMAVSEGDLKRRLGAQTKAFIMNASLPGI